MIKPTGKQILAEFKCNNTKLLNNGKMLELALTNAATKNNFSVKTKLHKFTPLGITAVAILGESHIIIHTYPEYNHLSLDCYTCFGNPNKIVKELIHKFKLVTLQIKEVSRGEKILEIASQGYMNAPYHKGVIVKYRIKKNLFNKKSKYQQIDIIDNDYFGKMLFLDNDLQLSEKDAEIYSYNLVFPISKLGNKLDKVLILGGGDGGVANELLKQGVKKVILVDIDKEVIKACKKFMPNIWSLALKNSKVKIIIADAYEYLENNRSKFDAIIYDLTSVPKKASNKMNQEVFLNKVFSNIKKRLNNGGIITMQCCDESNKKTLGQTQCIAKKYFNIVNLTKSFIPSYYTNWVFMRAENK